MHLDIHTIIDLLFIGNFISAAVLIAYQSSRRLQTPYLQFLAGKILQTLAWLLLGLRGEVSDLLSVHLGNSLLLTAFSLEALALATVKKPNRDCTILFPILGACSIAAFLLFAGHPGSVRIVVASSATMLIYGAMNLFILRDTTGSVLHKTIGASYLLFNFILFFRAGFAFIFPDMTLMSNMPIQEMTFLPLYLLMLVGGIGFILLLKEQNDLLLQESEEKYRTLVEGAHEAIAIIQDQLIVFANQKSADLVGMPLTDLIGRPFVDFIWPDDLKTVMENYEKRMRGGKIADRYDMRIIGPDDTPLWLAVSAKRIQWQSRPASLDLMTDITRRKQLEEERERIIGDLQRALSEVKTLSGLLPICASCKKIRDDQGYWNQIEIYIKNHSQATFTHGIRPECMKKLYPEVYEKMLRTEDAEDRQVA